MVATTTPVVARGVFLDARRSKWRHVPATVALLLLAAGTVALFTVLNDLKLRLRGVK